MAKQIAIGLQALVGGLSYVDTCTTKNNQIIREKWVSENSPSLGYLDPLERSIPTLPLK